MRILSGKRDNNILISSSQSSSTPTHIGVANAVKERDTTSLKSSSTTMAIKKAAAIYKTFN
jgi:hypothetical protein